MTDSVTGLLEALRRLDDLLSAAVAVAGEAFGPAAAVDPFRGLVLRHDDVERLLRRPPGEPVLAVDGQPGGTHSSTLRSLAEAFDLTSLDLDLLLVAAAPEIDLRYERLYGYLQDDVGRRRPSVDLAFHLLCHDAAERIAARVRVAPDAPLLRHDLLHLIVDPAQPQQPLLARAMRVDGQVLRLLLGESTLDPRLAGCAHVIDPGPTLADLWPYPRTRAALPSGDAVRASEPPLRLSFHGTPDAGQRDAARALAAEAGVPLLVVDLRCAARGDQPVEAIVRTAFREAWFRGTAIFVDGVDAVPGEPGEQLRAALTTEVALSRVLTVLSGAEPWAPVVTAAGSPTGVVAVPFAIPAAPDRLRSWRSTLDAAGIAVDEHVVEALAGRFRLTEAHIREAAATAAADRNVASDGVAAALFAAARAQSGRELGSLTRRIEHVHRWDALVLPDDTTAQLRELVARVTQGPRVLGDWGFDRLLSLGKGTCALFAGPSGTGKTMAADVVAGELGLDLYAIDLATVVSKYIGETEKNLKRIFDAARTANAVLFFDEADAVFGKRSEVRDAHDRYANVEIAYLLQKMEEYDGIAILATNLRENIDDAFLRRLHVIVEFPVPDEEHRERMWRQFIPEQAPVDDALDYAFLARQFRLPGGSIKNIVVAAAYLASANGGRIGMGHVMRAVWREHQKIGRVLPVSDVGDYAGALGRGV